MALDTTLIIVNYLRSTTKRTPRRGRIKITNSAQAGGGGEGVVIMSSTTSSSRRPIAWNMVKLFPRKIRETNGQIVQD